jgi:redox-sensitive bicupin YhaK (pirin superfamily)
LDNTTWQHELPSSRIGWLQVIEGTAVVNGEKVAAGDGVAFAPGEKVVLSETAGFHALFFDMTAQ